MLPQSGRARLLQLVGEHYFINRLEQTGSKLCMHEERGIEHELGDLILCQFVVTLSFVRGIHLLSA